MLSSFFFLAETTGDVADAGKAIALALGIGLGALGAGVALMFQTAGVPPGDYGLRAFAIDPRGRIVSSNPVRALIQ